MSALPVVSGQNCVKALLKEGFVLKRQKGSHIILRREKPYCQVTVPNHKVLDRGTLRSILRSADLSIEKFIELL